MKTPFAFIKKFLPSVAILIMLALASCKDDDGPETIIGDSASLANGTISTYLTNDKNGKPIEIGVKIDDAAYNSLLNLEDISLEFPAENNLTPFVHQYFDWSPTGHEPSGVYDLPHFDFHYYMTSHADREAIGLEDSLEANIFPSPDHLPAGYFPTGVVPLMGNHWLNSAAKELDPEHLHVFDETWIVGTFNGEVTFWEPMITKAFVDSQQNFEKAIPQPASYPQPGLYYPTSFGFIRDSKNKEYRFYLNNFVKR